jgi:hypothetical protein
VFPIGHTVLGKNLARALRPRLALAPLLVGTLLPDLIDKPLYYGLVAATGRRGAELGLVSGTRTFGHTGILLLLLVALAVVRRSRTWEALAWGVATHDLFDLGDLLNPGPGPSGLSALLFPLLGLHFPVARSHSFGEHLLRIRELWPFVGEAAGLAVLGRELLLWRRRRAATGRAS